MSDDDGALGDERLLTAQQVADTLGVSVKTLYAWRHDGGSGPPGRAPVAFRLGKHLRFRREDVEAWLSEHRDPEPSRNGSRPERG